MKKIKIFLILLAPAVLSMLVLVAGRFIYASKEHTFPALEDKVKEKNNAAIKLDKKTMHESGIVVSHIKYINYARRINVTGSVLFIKNIIDIRNRYINAAFKLRSLNANLAASKSEFFRVQKLYKEGQIASKKSLQLAKGKYESYLYSVNIAKEDIKSIKDLSVQKYGQIITSALIHNGRLYKRLVKNQELLTQINLPTGIIVFRPPQYIKINVSSGYFTPASFISPSPQTNPKFQGLSFFYMAKAGIGLLPGMNITAEFLAGAKKAGVFIPASAVVWWKGKAWIYVEKKSRVFFKRQIPTKTAVKGGFFVINKDLFKKELIVIKGAQLLLSKELMEKTHLKGEADND